MKLSEEFKVVAAHIFLAAAASSSSSLTTSSHRALQISGSLNFKNSNSNFESQHFQKIS
jgi:hypothetical protein